MVSYTEVFPILITADLPRLRRFYVDAMDGVVTYQFPPEGEAGYLAVDVAGGHLGLAADTAMAGAEGPQRFSLWFYVDDCDRAVERLRAAGAIVTEEPVDMPWGERVAKLTDPDGNALNIGQAAPG